ncbi:uncharacterized protein [Aquarana catesbeiana]|uniref:uncharacterized protein isoform X2 n=1 Tax=Aquarana catesbeiana TaxID=8400 RepID=UPI003CC9A5C6
MSSLEMDSSEPLSQNAEEKEYSLSNTVEMTSLPNSLESDMDLSESLENGNKDGSEDQDSQTNSSSNNSSNDESPPSQDQSPVSVKLSYTQVKVISPNNKEVSFDYGSQDLEKDGSCRVKVQTTTNGRQEVSPDEINGDLVSSLQVQVTTNGSQELLGGKNNGSQEIFVNGVTEISVTLSRENSNENRRSLKRKQGSVEEEEGKEKKFK